MSDLDLDRALDALVQRAATNGGRPGAAAAISAVRSRRRRFVTGVAVAAALAVGGMSAPQLLPGGLRGMATGAPDPAPLDAAALERATAGWIDGWSTEDSDARTFSAPSCTLAAGIEPAADTRGSSFFSELGGAAASVQMYGFGDKADLRRGWDDYTTWVSSCADFVPSGDVLDLPDGSALVHARVRYDADDEPGHRFSDVWLTRTGDRMAVLQVFTDTGAAPTGVVRAVGEALLAGTQDGWTEESSAAVPPQRPQMPPRDHRPLTAALDGWLDDRPSGAPPAPGHPCLTWPDDAGVSSSSGSDPRGWSDAIIGYDDDGTAAARQVATSVADLRSCAEGVLERRDLAGGVISYSYDLGDEGGHGGIWLAHNEDRAMVVTVHGGRSPVPSDSSEAVGAWMQSVLDLPWPEAP